MAIWPGSNSGPCAWRWGALAGQHQVEHIGHPRGGAAPVAQLDRLFLALGIDHHHHRVKRDQGRAAGRHGHFRATDFGRRAARDHRRDAVSLGHLDPCSASLACHAIPLFKMLWFKPKAPQDFVAHCFGVGG
jgi:hypothetical protein